VSTKRQQTHTKTNGKTDENDNPRATVQNERKARSNESALAERNGELDAIRRRTERLKALRLAHEARIQQHLRSVKTAPKSRAARQQSKEPEKKITLSDWLAQQRYFGRET
jgi:hypothetical protein